MDWSAAMLAQRSHSFYGRLYLPLSALALIICIHTDSVRAGELLNAPSTTFFVPANARPRDEILSDFPVRVNEISEDVAVSIEPPSETVTISTPVVGPNTPINLLIIDPKKLRNNKGEKIKLQALALISGKQEELTLEIKPNERGGSTAVHIGGDGDLPPFEKDEYDFILGNSFNERDIAIVKLKSEPPPHTHFSLVGPLAERFNIRSEGQLVYLTTIPCEAACTTPKKFTVVLISTNGHLQQITTITFAATSGDSIKFLNTPYKATVEEETGVFEEVVRVAVSGTTDEVLYALQDPTGLFSIHPKTGILMVQHPEFLTREGYGKMINLTVTATGKKFSVSEPILVSLSPVADRLKSFKFKKDSYAFTVPPGQHLVGMVELAEKQNDTVNYGIAEGGQGALTIDDNGVLFYEREPEKDSRNFTVLVTARSTNGQYFVATTWVEIAVEGIQSNPLKLTGSPHRSAVMSATTKRGTKLTTIELSDDDEDAVVQVQIDSVTGVCLNGSVANELSTELFRVKMSGKKAVLSLNEPLADVPLASIDVMLRAQDLAHLKEPAVNVSLHLIVLRHHRMATVKALPFEFIKAPKVVEVSGDAPVGTVVYSPVLAQSIITNSTDLIYGIESASDAFEVDNHTGIITTSKPFEQLMEDVITVTVMDPVAERSAQMNITVNVNAPSFHSIKFMERQYSGSLKRTDPLGSIVTSVEAKTDLGEAVKSFVLEGADAMFFTIDSQGTIRLKDSIANVARPELNFVVRVGDKKISATVPVHVSIASSDEGTELLFEKSSYDVKIMENLPVNGYVLHPKLINEQSGDGHVEYSLETSNEATAIKDLLEIGSNGRITVKEELQGYAGRYDFQVRATEGQRRASADVSLQILPAYKCTPVFTGDKNFEFTVLENSPVGTVIGTVSAADLDPKCEMKYHLWDPDTHEYTNETAIAAIDVLTGELRTKASFDHEDIPVYPLVLGLQAGAHHFVQFASTLRVLDIDDHPLQPILETLTVEVPEDIPLGTVVATMRAADEDESQSVFYQLRDGSSKEFEVNTTTGEVFVVSALDRETKDLHRNDNGPLFKQSKYFVLVAKNTLPGEKILTVSASDPDLPTSRNGESSLQQISTNLKQVFYRIKDTLFEYHGMKKPIQGVFSVESTSGIVTLDQTVSDFVGGVFHILLESMDSMEANAHKDQSIVEVYIHDESDIIRLDLPMPPAAATYEKIESIKKSIADATGLNVLVKDLQYHYEEGRIIYEVTDLRLVLLNRTTSDIIPAERAIAIADKHRSNMGAQVPSMTKAQVTAYPLVHQSIPPIAYVLSVFALSLMLVFMVFGFMMCHYRNRFQREKKLREDDIAIANALNKAPLRPMKISPVPAAIPTRSCSTFGPPIPAIEGPYAVQEMQLVVGAEDERRSRPW